jgi:hypothetical protein
MVAAVSPLRGFVFACLYLPQLKLWATVFRPSGTFSETNAYLPIRTEINWAFYPTKTSAGMNSR